MDAVAPKLFRTPPDLLRVHVRLSRISRWRENFVQVLASALAGPVRPVSRRYQAHALRGTSPQVAHAVRALLDVVGSEAVLIVD